MDTIDSLLVSGSVVVDVIVVAIIARGYRPLFSTRLVWAFDGRHRDSLGVTGKVCSVVNPYVYVEVICTCGATNRSSSRFYIPTAPIPIRRSRIHFFYDGNYTSFTIVRSLNSLYCELVRSSSFWALLIYSVMACGVFWWKVICACRRRTDAPHYI